MQNQSGCVGVHAHKQSGCVDAFTRKQLFMVAKKMLGWEFNISIFDLLNFLIFKKDRQDQIALVDV